MAPVANKDTKDVTPEADDEGFHSPSASRMQVDPRPPQATQSKCEDTSSDNDSQADSGSGSQALSDKALSDVEEDTHMASQGANGDEANSAQQSPGPGSENVPDRGASDRDIIERKAETLAEFIVYTLIGKRSEKTNDEVERTLLRCVQIMMRKHEILLKGMMRRLDITRETGYVSFVAVANELFEGEKMVITWGRIVALYAFGGQLALYCKEKNMEDFTAMIARFMGKYSSEFVAPYVKKVGGWNKICEEYPAGDDLEDKMWKFLTWTAIGLGTAAIASFFTSH